MVDSPTGIAPVVGDASSAVAFTRESKPVPKQHSDPVQGHRAEPKPESKPSIPQRQALTTDELAEMLRRINLTFDLFEVAAKYTIDESDGHVSVTLVNTRTGEVIRKIPPMEFEAAFSSFRKGIGLLFDQLF